MEKNVIKQVEKTWGSELWIVNCKEYCGKLLYLKQGAESSLHYHPVKKETFYCIQGQVGLTVESKGYQLNPFSRPKTIMPGEKHQFLGITDSVIIEFSTHHDDKDVVRITESRLMV